MNPTHLTLTTDFGEASPYVAAMKGVILSINPMLRLVDLTHQISPQNLRETAFFLMHSLPLFPAETLHLIVVDPGVGTERAALYVELGSLRLIAPDNGCWTWLTHCLPYEPVVYHLTERRYWRRSVSATFHGRDIFAPVAAHLCSGIKPSQIGKRVEKWETLDLPTPTVSANGIDGEILFVDHFGNLITNIPATMLGEHVEVEIGEHRITDFVRTYGEVTPGALIALLSSGGYLEVALSQGNVAEHLQAHNGDAVRVTSKIK